MPPQDLPLVNVIRAFDDPRNKRLTDIWDALAEFRRDEFRLMTHPNLGCRLRHGDMLNRIWQDFIMHRSERYVLITETDFLPSQQFLPLRSLSKDYPVIAAQYATRDPDTKKLKPHADLVGAWYVLVDREYIDLLDFGDAGPFNDPANGLLQYVHDHYGKGLKILLPRDCLPTHYGVQYSTGEHLFFSRHLADPPELRIAGVPLGDIQRKHDERVSRWIDEQPLAYKRILTKVGGAALAQAAGVASSGDRATSP